MERKRVMQDKRRNKNKINRKRGESMLGLITVIIGGWNMQQQLEEVNVTRRVADGRGGGRERVERQGSDGNKTLAFPTQVGCWVTEGVSICRCKITRVNRRNVTLT